MVFLPHVIERTSRGEREWDIFTRLLKDRIIFLGADGIDEIKSDIIVAQLLFLELENKQQDIRVYINSPGRSVTDGMAIYDTMRYLPNGISTVVIGQASSMAALLLAAGTKGKRYALPNSRIMIHQPWGRVAGTADDIVIQAKEIVSWKERLENILAEHTGQSSARIKEMTDRDYFMSPEEAKDYGLIDEIIRPS